MVGKEEQVFGNPCEDQVQSSIFHGRCTKVQERRKVSYHTRKLKLRSGARNLVATLDLAPMSRVLLVARSDHGLGRRGHRS